LKLPPQDIVRVLLEERFYRQLTITTGILNMNLTSAVSIKRKY
jgi:hypothetical protein